MGRKSNQRRIVELLEKYPNGLLSSQIRDSLNLSEATYQKERERLLIDGIAEKTKGKGGGLRLTDAFRAFLASKDEPDSWSATGTAFFVSGQGHLITNNHVIEGAARVMVYWGGQRYPAQPLAGNQEIDLALLKIDQKIGVVPHFRTNLTVGEEVGVFGFPLTDVLSRGGNFTTGRISALEGFEGNATQFQLAAPVQKGNSGGPVVDGSGNIIGVASGGLNDLDFLQYTSAVPQMTNFAVKAGIVIPFIQSFGVSATTATKAEKHPEWPSIYRRTRSFTAFVYCDSGDTELPEPYIDRESEQPTVSGERPRGFLERIRQRFK